MQKAYPPSTILMVDVTPEIAGGNWERGWDSAHVDASHFRGARNKCLLPIRKKVNPGSSDFVASPSYCVKGILACLPGPNFAFACVVLKRMISS